MRFPHANNEEMDDRDFVARWAAWFAGPSAPGLVDARESVPMLHSTVALQTLLDQGRGHGLDALCRKIVRPPYRNTMHATAVFMAANKHLLVETEAVNPTTGKRVKGATLSALGLELLSGVTDDEVAMRDAEAAIESDVDIETRPREFSTLVARAPAAPDAQPPAPVAERRIVDRDGLIAALVDEIERDPYQAHYRLGPVGTPLTGWSERLRGYFWPSPALGFARTMSDLSPLLDDGRTLAEALRPWDKPTQLLAVAFAQRVFRWGGVPQREVIWETVDRVIQSAINSPIEGAPMNSGWTKVAAFSTAHLEGVDGSQAIWDSRVSWSLVRRIDRILCRAGWSEVPTWLQHIGKVGGRGGTRWKVPVRLTWPNAYANWSSQFAASCLIREIRDHLNMQGLLAPQPTGSTGAWTVRAVEMVLFMDGY
jgi:hypothetical protein